MKIPTKLRNKIIISLGMITFVMITAYTLVVQYSLFSGLEEAALFDLNMAARELEDQYRENPDHPLPNSQSFKAYLDPSELPAWFTDRIDTASLKNKQLVMDEIDDPRVNNGQSIFFVGFTYDLPDQKRLYLIEIYTEKDNIAESFSHFERAELMTLVLGICFILIIVFALRAFFSKIATPIKGLLDWANTMTRAELVQPHPDFKIEEVNLLADLIQNGMGDLHQALNREQNFLKSASHELRTPIAVIGTNMDLLERLRPDPEKQERLAYQRIRRAIDNMHRLTETLLWLSRKEETMPTPENLDISEMVNELIRENQYLLTGKNVDLKLELAPAVVTLPRVSFSIALGNLIRNAFQYTNSGKVEISVSRSAVVISNTDHSQIDPLQEQRQSANTNYGFGVGLLLVEQITQKLNLPYQNNAIPGGHEAMVKLV